MQIVYLILAVLMLFAVWRMWRTRHGEYNDKPDPNFDPAEGQPEAHEALALLNQQDWAGLTRLYGRISPSDRYHLIESLAQLHRDPPPEAPADADSVILTILGGVLVYHGIATRGSGPATSVIKANAPRMMENLKAAAALLKEASTRNSGDSTTLALLLRLELVTTREQAQINNLVGRIQATGEDNIYAASNHLLANTPKWGGSASSMWRVANEWASQPPNAAWLAIPARAHAEEWCYAMVFAPPNAPERSAMIDLMQDDGFKRHLARLDDLFWAALQREPLSGAEASFAHNHFAFLMHIFRIEDRARPHLERIGGHIARYPWALMPTLSPAPTRLLADLRRQYGLPPLT
jgi:hypothetical protein